MIEHAIRVELFYDGFVVGDLAWLVESISIVAILTIEPLIILLLVWTNPLHGLVNSHVVLDTKGPFSALVFTYGAAFWVDIAYSYLLLLLGAFFIVALIHSFIRSTSLYQGQAGALLVALVAPWVGNALTIFGWSPFPRLDLTPFAFTITGIAMASSLFRFRLLDIRPIAREVLIENMRDVVLVVDEQNRIVDLNRAAQQVLGHSASELIGQPAVQVFSAWPQFVERYRDVSDQSPLHPPESRAGWPRISRGRYPGDAGRCGARPAFACRINLMLAHLLMLVRVGLWICRRASAFHRAPMLL